MGVASKSKWTHKYLTMKPVQPTSKTSQTYENAHIKRSSPTCTVATRPSKQSEHSRHTSLPSLLALIPRSPEISGIFYYRRRNSLSTYCGNHCCNQTSPPGSTSTAHSTSMQHPWARQEAWSLHMQKCLHVNLGTSVAIQASTPDQHWTTTDASWSSRHLRQQSSYQITSSSNTHPWH